MAQVSPQEIANFVRCIAAGIDGSKNPKRELVASDIRCAIAAVNGDEKAVTRVRSVLAAVQTAAPADPAPAAAQAAIDLRFSGPLSGELLSRAAAEVAKRRPELRGKKLQFSLSAKIAE